MSDGQLVEQSATSQKDFHADTKKVASGAGIYMGGGMLGRVFIVIGQIFMARVLTLEAFGLYSLGWTILRIMSNLTTFGMHVGVLKFGTPYYKEKNYSGLKNIIVQTLSTSLLVSSMIAGLAFVFADWISREVFHEADFAPTFRLFILAIPFASLLAISGATTRITKFTRYDVISQQLGRPLIHLILMFIFYFFSWGLLGFAGAATLSFAIAAFLGLYYVVKLFPEVLASPRTMGFFNRELLMMSIPATMVGTVNFINARIDRVMLGYFSVAEDVGIYQAISQVVIIFSIIQVSFNSILAPMFADFYQAGEKDRLQHIYLMGSKWALYIGLPIFGFILVAPNLIVMVLFGFKYTGHGTALVLLAIAELFNVSTGAVGSILYMSGRERRYLVISIIAFSINIILNILLIPHYGLNGTAFATGLGTMTLFGLCTFDIKYNLGLNVYSLRFMKGIGSIVIATLVGYTVNYVLNIRPLFEVIIIGLTITLTFLLSLYILGLDEEDIIFLKAIQNRMRKLAQRKAKLKK